MRRSPFRFADAALENAYRVNYVGRFQRQTRFASLFGTSVAAVYLLVDDLFLNPTASDFVKLCRYFYMIPVTLGWFVLWSVPRFRRWSLYWLIMIMGVPMAWAFTGTVILGGKEALFYSGVGLMQVNMFLALLLRLPLAISLIGLIAATTPFVIALAAVKPTLAEALNPLISVTSATVLSMMLAIQIERDQREAFRNEQSLQALRLEREEQNQVRLRWLQNIAGFLRHELRNAMIGISTSLSLIERRNSDPGLTSYLSRAGTSIDYMRRLLQRTGDATSVEQALREDALTERIVLEPWLQMLLEDYRVQQPEVEFDLLSDRNGVSAVWGHEARLTQALEKLINNAVEHCRERRSVEVELAHRNGQALIYVRNEGEPLPTDTSRLFELFHRERSDGSGENLGLGLYVTRTIVEFYGGQVTVAALPGAVGAEFCIALPLALA